MNFPKRKKFFTLVCTSHMNPTPVMDVCMGVNTPLLTARNRIRSGYRKKIISSPRKFYNPRLALT